MKEEGWRRNTVCDQPANVLWHEPCICSQKPAPTRLREVCTDCYCSTSFNMMLCFKSCFFSRNMHKCGTSALYYMIWFRESAPVQCCGHFSIEVNVLCVYICRISSAHCFAFRLGAQRATYTDLKKDTLADHIKVTTLSVANVVVDSPSSKRDSLFLCPAVWWWHSTCHHPMRVPTNSRCTCATIRSYNTSRTHMFQQTVQQNSHRLLKMHRLSALLAPCYKNSVRDAVFTCCRTAL